MIPSTSKRVLLALSLLSLAPSPGSCFSTPRDQQIQQARQDGPATPTVVIASTITIGPSSTPTPSTSPDLTDDKIFTSAVLNSSNTYREQHGAVYLRWNQTLEDFAVEYLDKVAPLPSSGAQGQDEQLLPQCIFEHSGGPYGENLAIGCNSAAGCVEAWGNEREKGYPFGAADGFSMETGHFSQLVWKNTTGVGCARRKCAGDKGGGYTKGWYLVCEYWPRGNVGGQYAEMVGAYQGSEPLGGGSGGAAGRAAAGEMWRVLVVGGLMAGLLWW
ncbi:pathogenesis-related protein 1 [Microdochium nivale]|nr:pathogenesis-related protein 1 [Microdochium nivale]